MTRTGTMPGPGLKNTESGQGRYLQWNSASRRKVMKQTHTTTQRISGILKNGVFWDK
jgi:hypothetical protein